MDFKDYFYSSFDEAPEDPMWQANLGPHSTSLYPKGNLAEPHEEAEHIWKVEPICLCRPYIKSQNPHNKARLTRDILYNR